MSRPLTWLVARKLWCSCLRDCVSSLFLALNSRFCFVLDLTCFSVSAWLWSWKRVEKKIVKVHEVGHKFIMYIYQEIQKLIKKCHKKYRMAKKRAKKGQKFQISFWTWNVSLSDCVEKKIVKVLQSKPQMMSIIPFAYFVSFFMLVLCTNNFLCDLANVKQTLLNQGLNIQIFCFLDEKNVFRIRKKIRVSRKKCC